MFSQEECLEPKKKKGNSNFSNFITYNEAFTFSGEDIERIREEFKTLIENLISLRTHWAQEQDRLAKEEKWRMKEGKASAPASDEEGDPN